MHLNHEKVKRDTLHFIDPHFPENKVQHKFMAFSLAMCYTLSSALQTRGPLHIPSPLGLSSGRPVFMPENVLDTYTYTQTHSCPDKPIFSQTFLWGLHFNPLYSSDPGPSHHENPKSITSLGLMVKACDLVKPQRVYTQCSVVSVCICACVCVHVCFVLLRLLSWRMMAESVLFITHSSSLPMPSGSSPRQRWRGSMFLFTSGMARPHTDTNWKEIQGTSRIFKQTDVMVGETFQTIWQRGGMSTVSAVKRELYAI